MRQLRNRECKEHLQAVRHTRAKQGVSFSICRLLERFSMRLLFVLQRSLPCEALGIIIEPILTAPMNVRIVKIGVLASRILTFAPTTTKVSLQLGSRGRLFGGCFRRAWRRLQLGFNGAFQLIRSRCACPALLDLAVAADQELLKVPLHPL